ncbi:MAG TPA: hypothetical protein VJ765_17975 [Chitinophagaceae bacterium]|nr:hypothetical protein [Chitinophagaceae bacterium]
MVTFRPTLCDIIRSSIIFVPLMKKGIAAILLLLYIAFSSGVIVSFHYCMNTFDSLQLGASEFEICGRCGMHTEDAGGCCNDEVKIFKIQDDQQTAAIDFKFPPADAIVAPLPAKNEVALNNSTHELFLNNHSPPINKQDTYLQNCVFRI